MPKDVVKWLGEKGMQQIVLKARKEMTGRQRRAPGAARNGPGRMAAGAIPGVAGAIRHRRKEREMGFGKELSGFAEAFRERL